MRDPAADSSLTLVSYNVHRCTGIDRRLRPQRIASALRRLEPAVVGLQEIDSRDGGDEPGGLIGLLARETGLHAVSGPAVFHPGGGFYGNLLLTRFPVEEVRLINLNVAGREPRGAIDADLRTGAGPLRVLVTHLGLTRWERRLQVQRLIEALQARPRTTTALLGDFNEWLPTAQSLLPLDQWLGATARPRTFPAWRPLLALDRIWIDPARSLLELRAVLNPLTLRASDHLPLLARIRWPPEEDRTTPS